MSVYVFLGSTLTAERAQKELDARFLPPVQQGDILRLLREREGDRDRPRVIGIVDGLFRAVPAVWHKEILQALAEGCHVFGAASMGALRAAELHAFGMRGVGTIFEQFRDGVLQDDDEVAVAHASSEFGFRELSCPMVDLRDVLEAAAGAGILTPAEAAALVAHAKSRFYAERSQGDVLAHAERTGLSPGTLRRLGDFFAGYGPSLKARDALRMLAEIRGFLATDPAPFAPQVPVARSIFLQDLEREIASEAERARALPKTHLPDGFWDGFVRDHWEKRPGVFPGLGASLVTANGAFANVLAACDRWRSGAPAQIRFFREDALLQSRLGKYLPIDRDRDLAGYAARIAPLLQGQGFGLTVNGFARYDFSVFTRVRRFLGGLYERVGLPGDVTDLDVFLGNYRRTPFGIHTDTSSNFCVVLDGKKRFLLWPGPVLDERRDLHHSVDYDHVRSEAIVLEGAPGDVVYWPSSYWHIAEGGGELSGAMNISLYVGDRRGSFVDGAIGSSTSGASGPGDAMLPWTPQPAGLPPALEAALGTALTARNEGDPAVARASLVRAWLARTTSFNMFRSMPDALPLPSLASIALSGRRVQIELDFPIVTLEHGGVLFCSAHGHVIEFPAVPQVVRMIERLNRGREEPIEALVADTVGWSVIDGARVDVGPTEVLTVLENLLAMRAVRELP
jgi:hypothetical protein